MNFLLVLCGIWFVVWVAKRMFGSSSHRTPVARSPPSHRSPPVPLREDVYRPSGRRSGTPRIVFDPPKVGAGPIPFGDALAGLHDAFTGAPLNIRLGLYQCTTCKVYYHAESVAVLRQENASRCVACGSVAIVALTESQTDTSRGRDYQPDVVTLANFREHFNRVVTFEGRVQTVRVSRRGMDYAVMFENAPWSKGFKLVFLRGAVRSVGGPDFIHSLKGRTVRVRGLVINHNRFGPEILISERGMILGVTP